MEIDGGREVLRIAVQGAKHVAPDYFARLKAQRKPTRGDILFTAVGATLGIPAIVNTDDPFCFQRHVAIMKLKRDVIDLVMSINPTLPAPSRRRASTTARPSFMRASEAGTPYA